VPDGGARAARAGARLLADLVPRGRGRVRARAARGRGLLTGLVARGLGPLELATERVRRHGAAPEHRLRRAPRPARRLRLDRQRAPRGLASPARARPAPRPGLRGGRRPPPPRPGPAPPRRLRGLGAARLAPPDLPAHARPSDSSPAGALPRTCAPR